MLRRVHRNLGIPLDELGLQHLVPVVTQDQLKGLTKPQQDDFWYEKQLYLEGWVGEYFQNIKQQNNSLSPRTKSGKLTTLTRIGHYLYRRQVRRNRDYDSDPYPDWFGRDGKCGDSGSPEMATHQNDCG